MGTEERETRAREHARTSFRYLNKLADISISLSSEDDLMTLLRKILNEGQNIDCCDAASLFLINEVNDHERELVFKLTQNDSMEFPFEELRLPLDEFSIAGYVAHTDTKLNIPDAYQLSKDVPYSPIAHSTKKLAIEPSLYWPYLWRTNRKKLSAYCNLSIVKKLAR